MERIQAAIQKAKERRGEPVAPGLLPPGAAPRLAGRTGPGRAVGPAWAGLEAFEPDPRLLAKNRVVTFADVEPTHVTFDMMRTKVLRAMRQNGWTSLGVTSPTPGCGKTTTTLNLGFSLAHQPDVRTVLVDLDLRRPAVAKQLGLTRPQSMASVLQGTRDVAENFVRYGDNLAIGTNATGVRSSSELLLNAATAGGVAAVRAAFLPDVILWDLPPMLSSDDVMAFVPHLDCVLLVAAAEQTRLDEVDKCEQELAEQTNVLGVVLNKCRYMGEDYGYY
jgi:Mrp family chromosome partitioning ATPase